MHLTAHWVAGLSQLNSWTREERISQKRASFQERLGTQCPIPLDCLHQHNAVEKHTILPRCLHPLPWHVIHPEILNQGKVKLRFKTLNDNNRKGKKKKLKANTGMKQHQVPSCQTFSSREVPQPISSIPDPPLEGFPKHQLNCYLLCELYSGRC